MTNTISMSPLSSISVITITHLMFCVTLICSRALGITDNNSNANRLLPPLLSVVVLLVVLLLNECGATVLKRLPGRLVTSK